jgi:high-affinity nickel-transport protein
VAIGVVHGLAGSAAIALLLLTTIRDRLWALLYLGLFGAGTVAGMILMTAVMSVPLALASRKTGALERRVASLTGTLSLVFGLVLAYRLGIGGGLFTGAPHWTPR